MSAAEATTPRVQRFGKLHLVVGMVGGRSMPARPGLLGVGETFERALTAASHNTAGSDRARMLEALQAAADTKFGGSTWR